MRQLGKIKICANCGAEFHVKPSDWNRLINCSHDCRGAYQAKKKREGQTPEYQPESNTYLIPLTKGYRAIVDACDIDLAQETWYASDSRGSGPAYARRVGKRRESIRLHRVIMTRVLGRELTECELVDHIDGNTMNNRRSNLRVATHAQNVRNARGRTGAYKGTRWNKLTNRYTAEIQAAGVRKYLGSFATAKEAHEAYVKAAIELHGEFAHDGVRSLSCHKDSLHE